MKIRITKKWVGRGYDRKFWEKEVKVLKLDFSLQCLRKVRNKRHKELRKMSEEGLPF